MTTETIKALRDQNAELQQALQDAKQRYDELFAAYHDACVDSAKAGTPAAANAGGQKCPHCGTNQVSLERTCHNSACSAYARAETVYEGWRDGGNPTAATAGGLPWMRVEGEHLYISRSNWVYLQATNDDAGTRDEARYNAIGRRSGDMVLHFNGAWLDAQDLATMLSYVPAAKQSTDQ